MPFTGSPNLPQLMVSARRRGPVLDLAYHLSSIEGLRWSQPAADPQRRDGLWQGTCLECFVALPGSECYWEFNVTPTGDWNCYRFDAYRRGMRAETAISALPVTGSGNARALQIPLDKLGLAAADLSVCAVLQREVGDKLHYALHHNAGSPDFHCRESLVWRV